MPPVTPVVSLEEIFQINKKIRWAALTTDRGDVIYYQQRPGVESLSPAQFDEDFAQLGPLTLLGTAEKYSEYVRGVDHIVVWFGAVVSVFSRIGSQVLSVTLEKDLDALSQFLSWLESKKSANS
jgi:hypothetical protein